MKNTIKELATTYRTDIEDVRGDTSVTGYPFQPIVFQKDIVDAAQKKKYFEPFCYVTRIGAGQASTIVPYRLKYLSGKTGDITWDTGTAREVGTAIVATKLNNVDGQEMKPTMRGARVSIENYTLRTNAIDLIRYARETLIYAIGDKIDIEIGAAIGDATCAKNDGTVTGAQTLFGGDATSAATLAAGDVISTDLIAKAKRYLGDTALHYRNGTNGKTGTEALASVQKNPWPDEGDYVLFIGPAQEEALLKDSQFVNAAEYGKDTIIHNGQIPGYLGIKFIKTHNLERTAASSTAPDGSSAAVACTRCILMKPRVGAAICYGLDPTISIFDNVPELAKDILLEVAYDIEVIHDDSIVFIDVADE